MTRLEHDTDPQSATCVAERGLPFWLRRVLRHLDLESPPHDRVIQQRDLKATMSDGPVLLADRWRPAGVVQAPLVLVRTPYGRRSMNGLLYGRILAHFGFQVVIQSCRGTQDSGGVFDHPFTTERGDGRDTVAWLRSQPWYPGSFATAGGSYVGYTELAIAAEAAEDLAAAVWTVAPTATRDVCWPDGSFAPGTALRWTAGVTRNPVGNLTELLRMRADDKRLRAAAMTAPLMTGYTLATRKTVPFFEAWLSAESPDAAVWREQDLSAALESITCPVLVQTGWYDVFLEESLYQYERLRERGVDARLSVGPWHHIQNTLPAIPDMVRFLTEVLLGGAPRAGGRRVRLVEVGSKTPDLLDGWPLEDTVDVVYHLVGGALCEELPSVDSIPTSTSFTYDPANPTPAVGGSQLDALSAGARDNRKLESRSDVITFDSSPASDELVVRGRARVSLAFSSDRPATSVFLRLCDVAPDGRSTNLTDRLVSLKAKDRHEDGSWHMDVELPPVAARLAQGHRVRLQVSSGAFPRYARHPGTAEPLATATTYLPARQTIHHSLARPGRVTVPVALGSEAQSR